MPSSSNPSNSVSLVVVPPSGGGAFPSAGDQVGLQIHLEDTSEAHPASAITLPDIYPPSGQPLIYPDGLVEGNTLLDFIGQNLNARPADPPTLGTSRATSTFSGIPDWDTLEYINGNSFGVPKAVAGAWSKGSDVQFTKCLTDQTLADLRYNLFPADRGIVCLYYEADGDFLSGSSTLVHSLWLGPTSERPAGLASVQSADFNPLTRTSAQPTFLSLGPILDHRYPREVSYAPGTPYDAFQETFPYHQLAEGRFASGGITLSTSAPDYAGSYLLVHWKETFPSVLTDIDGSNLATDLVASNCYSAVPVAGNFDSGDVATLNRKKIFPDPVNATAPALILSHAANGHAAASTTDLSGVTFYSADVSALVSVDLADLFGVGASPRGYLTGKVASPPDVPTGFQSYEDPLTFVPVHGAEVGVPYFQLQKISDSSFLGPSNAPSSTEDVTWSTTQTLASGAGTVDLVGYSTTKIRINFPHRLSIEDVLSTPKLLYHNPSGSLLSTSRMETFLSETYRYTNTVSLASNNKTVLPAGGDAWVSATDLIADTTGIGTLDSETGLQVSPGNLRYPIYDYSSGHRPSSNPDYSAVFTGDTVVLGPDAHGRRFTRAFDTERVTSTGKIRLVGFDLTHFGVADSGTGVFPNRNPGKVRIRVRVPGTTDWLDLGIPFSTSGGCLISEQFLGLRKGTGDITASNTFRSDTVTEDFSTYVEPGDTLFILSGNSRGIYRINSVSGRQIFIETTGNPYGTFSVESDVGFEIYRGTKLLGTEYRYSTDKTGSGPTGDNGSGQFPVFVDVTIFKFNGDTTTYELGLLEMEWNPLWPTSTNSTRTLVLSAVEARQLSWGPGLIALTRYAPATMPL